MARKKSVPDDCMPRCASCAFFVGDPKEEIGDCRRYPPTTFPDGDEGLGFSFSITVSNMWCGEFIRKCDS
jgi:hypothetical protein